MAVSRRCCGLLAQCYKVPYKFGTPSMFHISLLAAASLTGISKRTLWRRLGDGSLPRAPSDAHGRVMVPVGALLSDVPFALKDDEWALVQVADAGGREAQNAVAYLLMGRGHWAGAKYWLELAAKQNDADAMQWLGWLVAQHPDSAAASHEALGWLARAAKQGSAIAKAQVQGLGMLGGK